MLEENTTVEEVEPEPELDESSVPTIAAANSDEVESAEAAPSDEATQDTEEAVVLEEVTAEDTSVAVGDFDIDFDDPEMDLGPSLAEQLASINIPETDLETAQGTEQGTTDAVEDRNWYVIHCYSGYENKVRHNLEQRIETMDMQDMIFDVVVPTEEEIEIKDGKRKPIERRVFPGYILVQLALTEESWYVVRNTPGVTGFVGMGNTPTPLSEQEVSEIMKRMAADAPTIKVFFKPGQKIRITDGPFNDFIGTVGEIDMQRGKVRVMVSFFGRDTPVEMDFLQVEKI